MTELEAVRAIEEYAQKNGGKLGYETDYAGNVVSLEWNSYAHLGPPEEICWLKHAKKVEIYQIFDSDIRWVGAVEGIEELILHNVEKAQLPETWACASTLHYLWYGGASKISTSIRQLKNLSFLQIYILSYAAKLPDWLAEFPKLKTLNLSDSHIQSIPYSLVEMGLPFVIDDAYAENCINLTGATLKEGDLNLFGQSRDVIEAFYAKDTLRLIRECKVIFLGDGAAGKSCLIDRMVNDTFDKDSPVTHGVRTIRWETKVQGKSFKLRILDFGGQEILFSMHRCFLTGHTVYVVVCEARDDAEIDAVAARWLDTVHAFAPGCPVILALNKADLNPNVSVNEKDLKKRNPALKRVMRTSAAVGRGEKYGTDALSAAIRDEIPGCINRYQANADMLAVKRALEDMTEDYISADAYRGLCDKHRLTDPKLQHGMLNFFKELGVAYYYEKESGEFSARLDSVRVLNPAWLTNGIYRLIVRAPESGFLAHADIRKTLGRAFEGDIDKTVYSAEETDFILHVMRQFEISHKMERDGKTLEVIPLKMPKDTPNAVDEFPKETSLHLRWEGIYMPNNLVHRLMIRKFSELDKDCAWRTGGRFWKPDSKCLALAEMKDNALDVYVAGDGGVKEYMESFRDIVFAILRERNLKAEEFICVQRGEKVGKISYNSAMRQYNDGIQKVVFIEGIGDYVSLEDLLKATYPDYLKEAEEYLRRQERGFPGAFPKEPDAPPKHDNDSEERKNDAEAVKAIEEAKTIKLQRWIIIALIVLLAILAVAGQWETVLNIIKALLPS